MAVIVGDARPSRAGRRHPRHDRDRARPRRRRRRRDQLPRSRRRLLGQHDRQRGVARRRCREGIRRGAAALGRCPRRLRGRCLRRCAGGARDRRRAPGSRRALAGVDDARPGCGGAARVHRPRRLAGQRRTTVTGGRGDAACRVRIGDGGPGRACTPARAAAATGLNGWVWSWRWPSAPRSARCSSSRRGRGRPSCRRR